MREIAVRSLRTAFRWWPFMRGRGWLLRLARVVLGTSPVRFAIGPHTLIEGALDDWTIVWAFMCLHEWDKPFQRSLGLLARADEIIDVGANVGSWSLLAAAHNPASRIHAFEPVPSTVERLCDHVRLNGVDRIVVNPVAVGAEHGWRPFFAVKKHTGASSFYERREDVIEMRVPVVTLDEYVERERLGTVDLIKVDVEGAEMLVFRGARRLLSSDVAPAVFFELNDDLCASCGATGHDVKQLLVDQGYGIYRWRRSGFASVAVEEVHRGEDLFALKPRHWAGVSQP